MNAGFRSDMQPRALITGLEGFTGRYLAEILKRHEERAGARRAKLKRA